ncbi:unnamed protein product [Camellia sinensis]
MIHTNKHRSIRARIFSDDMITTGISLKVDDSFLSNSYPVIPAIESDGALLSIQTEILQSSASTLLFSILYIGVFSVAHSAHSHSHAAAPAPAVDCTTLVLKMTDCLSYVTNGSTVKKPEGTCCSVLKTVLTTNEALRDTSLADGAAAEELRVAAFLLQDGVSSDYLHDESVTIGSRFQLINPHILPWVGTISKPTILLPWVGRVGTASLNSFFLTHRSQPTQFHRGVFNLLLNLALPCASLSTSLSLSLIIHPHAPHAPSFFPLHNTTPYALPSSYSFFLFFLFFFHFHMPQNLSLSQPKKKKKKKKTQMVVVL